MGFGKQISKWIVGCVKYLTENVFHNIKISYGKRFS